MRSLMSTRKDLEIATNFYTDDEIVNSTAKEACQNGLSHA